MPIVAITVECDAANSEKCFTLDLVKVAEDQIVPLTWLINVSEHEPMANIKLYHTEYFHRIPSWHEYGLQVTFENNNGYIADPDHRANLIRLGKDVLKQGHLKPTSFRATYGELIASDIKALEDIGILVDASATPNVPAERHVGWDKAPTQTYHPSYDNLLVEGNAQLLISPVATYKERPGYLTTSWPDMELLLEKEACMRAYVLVCKDSTDCIDSFVKTIQVLKDQRTCFVTLTQMATNPWLCPMLF